MKLKIIVILIVIILLIPIPRHLKDGGTVQYNSILYQVEKVNNLEKEKGTIIKILGIEIYNNVQNNSNINYFYYYEGSFSGAYEYEIKKTKDKFIFKAIGLNGRKLNVEKEINENDLNKLETIINDNKIYKWNNFNEKDNQILDGSSFTLKINYENGKKIEANGYMKYPKNYDQSSKKLQEYLQELSKS